MLLCTFPYRELHMIELLRGLQYLAYPLLQLQKKALIDSLKELQFLRKIF